MSGTVLAHWAQRAIVCLLLALPMAAAADRSPVRIGLTPVFLDDRLAFVKAWQGYLERRLNRPVVFVQRGSYREITDLLVHGKLDFAWICGFPYVENTAHMQLLAVPLYRGAPLYQSYLIVPAADVSTASIVDLRGKVFAYSDPHSNSGFLYPQHALLENGVASKDFFARTFFTWAHRKVVEAVATGLAAGGAVDGYVWETLHRYHPELTSRTRVVQKSPEFGHPPFVARTGMPAASYAAMRAALLTMRDDAEGEALLAKLNLDGFVAGSPRLFEGIANMARRVNGGSGGGTLR